MPCRTHFSIWIPGIFSILSVFPHCAPQVQSCTREDFLASLEMSERAIKTLDASVKVYSVPGSLPRDVPMIEAHYLIAPGEGLVSSTGMLRLMEEGSPEAEGSRDAKGYRIVSFLPDGSDYPLSPMTLMGWNLLGDGFTPLYRTLGSENFEIERIRSCKEMEGHILLVEAAQFSFYLGRRIPQYKWDFYFDRERSFRPVRIDLYNDWVGAKVRQWDAILLEEISPGIWIPTRGRISTIRTYREISYDETKWGNLKVKEFREENLKDMDRFLALSREDRWAIFRKTGGGEVLSRNIMEATVTVNEPIPVDAFSGISPSGTVVRDAALR